MFQERSIDAILRRIKRFIPKPLFDLGARIYHPLLAWTGALRYGFPSRHLTVIGVTGTKGKSTTVYLTARILEQAGHPVAAIGSLGYKIKEREWPNLLKMTMPGRWKIQKFLREAADAGCTHVVMEAPSEGLAQARHLGVRFDCAVFTNLHPEHIESHGGFEAYRAAKQILFRSCHGIHIYNADDPNAEYFSRWPARKHLSYGINAGDMRATEVSPTADRIAFTVGHERVQVPLGGLFNIYNCLAALAVADAYGVPVSVARPALESILSISGRLEWIQKEPFGVVVDYAHTPDSLRAVYEALRPQAKRLICVLGAAGGGRDKWKRPEFGAIAEQYCDQIVLTNEDPYEEQPEQIIRDIHGGISSAGQSKVVTLIDRGHAITDALTRAQEGDIVVITGKGSETSIALAGGHKVPWSDAQTVRGALQGGSK